MTHNVSRSLVVAVLIVGMGALWNPALAQTGEQEKLPGEIVFTSKEYASFEQAQPHAITEVKDGDPLWMYVRLPEPIAKYVDADPANKDKSGKVKSFIKMGIGMSNEPEGDYQHCNTLATDEELTKNELIFNLSPGKLRPAGPQFTCFLVMAAQYEPKVRQMDIRMRAKTGDKQVTVARGPLTLDLSGGKEAYMKVFAGFEQMQKTGTAATNTLPKQGKFKDKALQSKALAKLKAAGITPVRTWYSQDEWQVLRDMASNRKDYRSVHGAYTYKKKGGCFYGVFEIVQDYTVTEQLGEIDVQLRGDNPIDCKKL